MLLSEGLNEILMTQTRVRICVCQHNMNTPPRVLTGCEKSKTTSNVSDDFFFKWAATWYFLQCCVCNQQRHRPACANGQSDQSLWLLLEYSTSINLLTGHHLELLSLKKGAPARLSLLPSKCHKVVVAQMWLAKRRLVYDLFCRQILKLYPLEIFTKTWLCCYWATKAQFRLQTIVVSKILHYIDTCTL